MDQTELRLRKVELTLRATETLVTLQSHRRIAVLGASLTLGGGASVGALVGQLPPGHTALVVLSTGMVILDQFRGLRKASENWGVATDQALRNIDKLMAPEDEPDADGEEGHQG